MDEALALPSEKAVRIALRTQHVLAHESGVTNTVDPLAGSYFVESLTNRIEEEAMNYIEKIDGMGGMLSAIETGFIQYEIAESAYRYQKDVEGGKKIVVGVNKYELDERTKLDTLKVDANIGERQKEGLLELRRERDGTRVSEILDELKAAASTDENLMPIVLEAVRNYATMGEICDVLRDVFGEFKAKEVF